jgi:predicted peptidase
VFDYQNNITTPLQLAVDLVKHLLTTESIDKKRVYITGLSMGGMGTLEAVYRYPKLFAAAAPVCGGADIQAFTKKQARIPFWIFHGDADAVVPVAFSRDLVAHLQSLGATVKYSEYPGVNHNSWENAYAEPEFMSWLFAQRR